MFSLALVAWFAALVPCSARVGTARPGAGRCCGDGMKRCCCRGETGRSPASEPAAPATKTAHEQPAEVAVIAAIGGTPARPATSPRGFAVSTISEAGPIYLSTRSFRC